MTINQIYNVMNNIKANITSDAANVVDYTTFVNFGNDVLSSDTNKEIFYSTLVDRIGRTVFAIREYKAHNREVNVDEFTFGNILQKISFQIQNAELNSNWDEDSENPYAYTAKSGIQQKLFAQSLPTFSFKDVIYDYQLESAFTNESAMGGFIAGLYTRMYNALELDIEGMNNYALSSLYVSVFNDTQTNNVRRRNLLAEYNTAHAESQLTVENCLENEKFLEYVCIEMGTMPTFLERMSKQYNNGTVERFTNKENLVVEVNTAFEKAYSVYLKSNTFHDELVELPNYITVPFWQRPNAPQEVRDNEGTIKISNLLAVMRDKDACACTLERKKIASMYDNLNDRTYVKLSADKRYIVDTSENCILFYIE